MTDFRPTEEQATIVEAVQSTDDNIIIEALAGAAKTTTLVLISKALASRTVLCLAFNKRIAVEMAERMPSNVSAQTLNSLGHRIWGQQLGRRLNINSGKMYGILKDLLDGGQFSPEVTDLLYEDFSSHLKNLGLAKANGWIPDGLYPYAKQLCTDADFFDLIEEKSFEELQLFYREAMNISIRKALAGEMDFDDQLYMSGLFPCSYPKFDVVLVDESQDLSAINHQMLRRLRFNRLIAVGDRNQAIYAFRGADSSSMDIIRKEFDMVPYSLSTTFRCPQAVVQEARWKTPHMQWAEWAKPGSVERPTSWSLDSIPDSAAIVCRTNAPLFSLAVRFFQAGRYAELVGNDIAKGLVNAMRKFGKPDLSRESVMDAIERWETSRKKVIKDHSKVVDQAECLRIFARASETLGGAIAFAERIMAQEGRIKLMSGHKSKGFEFDEVFLLNRSKMDTKRGQEGNLLYVMQTRAKSRLVYIEEETFADTAAPPEETEE